MKNNTKLISAFVLMILFQWVFLKQYNVRTDLMESIITFYSILFGFYITSLAIFATSRYVSSLYKIIDKSDKSQSLLDALVGNYKFGLKLALGSITYFLIVQFIINQNEQQQLPLSCYFLIPFVAVIFSNIAYSYFMLHDLISIICQEAKQNEKSNNQ